MDRLFGFGNDDDNPINTTATIKATRMNIANVKGLAKKLKTELTFCKPCSIILAGCNAGNLLVSKGNAGKTWPQILADETGCSVSAPLGYISPGTTLRKGTPEIHVSGIVDLRFGPYTATHKKTGDTQIPSRNKDHKDGAWRIFSPGSKNDCDKPVTASEPVIYKETSK